MRNSFDDSDSDYVLPGMRSDIQKRLRRRKKWSRRHTPDSPTTRLSALQVRLPRQRQAEDCLFHDGDEQDSKNGIIPTKKTVDIHAKPTISWKRYPGMKSCLVYMENVFEISRSDKSRIFWQMFNFELIRCGLSLNQNLSDRLESQWHEIYKRHHEKDDIFRSPILNNKRIFCADLDEKITSAAHNLGIVLIRKSASNLKTHPYQSPPVLINLPRLPSPPRFDLTEVELVVRSTKGSTIGSLSTPTHKCHRTRYPLQSAVSDEWSSNARISPSSLNFQANGHPVPLLIWRAHDRNSHGVNCPSCFKAARFNHPGITVPPGPNDENPIILDCAEQHLYASNFDSPFISVASSFIWLVHKALSMEKNSDGEDAYISLMSGDDVTSYTKIYHSKILVDNLRLQHRARVPGYKANFEWLVWGEIKATSILSIVSIRALKDLAFHDHDVTEFFQLPVFQKHKSLKHVLKSLNRPPATQSTGRAIGKLIRVILEEAQHTNISLLNTSIPDLVRGFLQNWQVPVNLVFWDSNKDLASGIYEGLETLPYTCTPTAASPTLRPHTTSSQIYTSQGQLEQVISTGLRVPLPRTRSIAKTVNAKTCHGYRNVPSSQSSFQNNQYGSHVVSIIDITSDAENDDDSDTSMLDAESDVADEEPIKPLRNAKSKSETWKDGSHRVEEDAWVMLLSDDENSDSREDIGTDRSTEDDDDDNASVYWLDNGLPYPIDDSVQIKREKGRTNHSDQSSADHVHGESTEEESNFDDLDSDMEDLESSTSDAGSEATFHGFGSDEENVEENMPVKTKSKMVIRQGFLTYSPYD